MWQTNKTKQTTLLNKYLLAHQKTLVEIEPIHQKSDGQKVGCGGLKEGWDISSWMNIDSLEEEKLMQAKAYDSMLWKMIPPSYKVMNMRYLEFYVNFPRDCRSVVCQGLLVFALIFDLDIMDNNKRNMKEKLFLKSFKHGTRTLVLSKQGVKLETGHEKIQSGSTGYQTHIRTKSAAQMSLLLYLCPIENICHWRALHPSVYGCVCVFERA